MALQTAQASFTHGCQLKKNPPPINLPHPRCDYAVTHTSLVSCDTCLSQEPFLRSS